MNNTPGNNRWLKYGHLFFCARKPFYMYSRNETRGECL